MLDEFILLLESEKEKVKEVLKPHLHEKIFKRLLGGFFDETQKRFVAFAFMPIKKSMFYEYDYLFELSNSGHSAVCFLPETTEKTRKYIDQNTFTYKSTEERIEEGIYKSLLIAYTGEFDFDEWNILRDCCFSDNKDKNKLLKSKVDRVKNSIKDHFFKSSIFLETAEHYVQLMNHARARNENAPVTIPVELRPFVGHSELVSLVRTENKSKINLSFQDYIKKAVYTPLIIRLKTHYPTKYQTVWGFYGQDCNFLIPSHRQFCLMIFVVTDNRKKTSLQFYLYNLKEDKLYNWTYFILNPYDEKPSYDLIVKIFSPISQLDDMKYLIEARSNFDDDDFWNNFVFKKSSSEYMYLTE
ncbi:MAG TPA: hypothetical protein VNX40_05980, partial [Mucilaginibacter sp.]|nr:hypothetical protein [Mucilaginibacter sp.]